MELTKNILLVGPPRVGKTTVVQKTMALLKGRCGGFYTQAADKRYYTNFRIVTVEGRSRSASNLPLLRRLKLGVAFNHGDLEHTGALAVQRALERYPVIVIDQLGTLELESGLFRDVVRAVLDSPRCSLATATTSDHRFLDEVKLRPDVAIYGVNESNRATLSQVVGRHIARVLAAGDRLVGEPVSGK